MKLRDITMAGLLVAAAPMAFAESTNVTHVYADEETLVSLGVTVPQVGPSRLVEREVIPGVSAVEQTAADWGYIQLPTRVTRVLKVETDEDAHAYNAENARLIGLGYPMRLRIIIGKSG